MFNRSKKNESKDPVTTEIVSAVSAPVTANAEISSEIIAVITAAIAAMAGSDSVADGLIVRKISRIHGEKISWSNAGLSECIESRKF